jgi:hypothetical protein
MSPGLLQLQSVGEQDVFLTQSPQINIFKYSYYRYVNFATEVVKLPINTVVNFNKKASCEISKRGHLLSKLYLHLKLPALVKKSGEYVCWSDTLGYAIFSDPIELEIGGVVIDKLYPQFLDIWDEFSNIDKTLGRNFMTMKSDYYNSTKHNAIKPFDLIIPLDFWFCKNPNQALPIVSMYSQDIKINFKLKAFSDVINYDGLEPDPVNIIESHIYAEYIFLDDIILPKFQEQRHTFVIDQIQYNELEIISGSAVTYNSILKFNHPVKELFWGCVEKRNIDNNNYFVYATDDELPIISEAALLLDGVYRFDYLPEFYFRSIFPNNVHSTIPMKYVYCLPFAIKPEDTQPTGSINMSRFSDVMLSLKFNPHYECFLYVFALSYNILTIEKGTFTLEFSS